MIQLLNASWEAFVDDVGKQEIILFGASSCAELVVNSLKVKLNIKCIVDNDCNKHNKILYKKYKVCSPDILKESKESDVVLIASSWYNEIIKQLKDMGFRGKVYSYLNILGKGYSPEDIELLYETLPKLKAICYDQESIDIIDKIVEKRLNGETDYSDICSYDKQYFIKDIFDVVENEVFIDGGAFNGDTVKECMEFAGEALKKAYAFEMDDKNYALINREDFDDRVEFYNLGLWDKEEEVSFFGNDGGSLIIEDASETARCITLDSFVKDKVTFIKMDIEGAEMNALRGARNIIQKYKPKLAICIYHKFNDLWEIPLYIHKLVPEYKLYVRHHAKDRYETVVYATI